MSISLPLSSYTCLWLTQIFGGRTAMFLWVYSCWSWLWNYMLYQFSRFVLEVVSQQLIKHRESDTNEKNAIIAVFVYFQSTLTELHAALYVYEKRPVECRSIWNIELYLNEKRLNLDAHSEIYFNLKSSINDDDVILNFPENDHKMIFLIFYKIARAWCNLSHLRW